MFSTEGNERSHRQNRYLAGSLALIAGFVNSAGFVLLGTFTSHATGNVGRFADEVARNDVQAAGSTLVLVASFFAGAFLVSVILESRALGERRRAYALALSFESALLVLFVALAGRVALASFSATAAAGCLCVAMGLQNALVTRLSGAVVRTTHLTGVLTDLGIEGARWARFLRSRMTRARTHSEAPTRPEVQKGVLLATIAASFTIGALGGAMTTMHLTKNSMLVPACGVALLALYALFKRPTVAAPSNRPMGQEP